MPALSMGYDGLNRMITSTPTSGATTVYAYGPGGQRVGQSAVPDPVYWQNNRWSFYVYGPDGRHIADCGATYVPANPQYPQMNLHFTATCSTAYVYFRGKLVRKEAAPLLQNGVWVAQGGRDDGDGPAGVGDLPGVHGGGVLLPVRGGGDADGERHAEVRDLHAGLGDGAGLRAESLLREPDWEVYDGGPVCSQRGPGGSGELEPVCVCAR